MLTMKEPWSPLATRVKNPRDVRGEREHAYGVAYHTTGRGVVEKAAQQRRKPLDIAVEHYTTAGAGFAHYCVGHAGEIVQIAPESEPAWQMGWGKWERDAYRGTALPLGAKDWRELWARDYQDKIERVPRTHYAWWDVRWSPAHDSPYSILKAATRLKAPAAPNAYFTGIEFLWHPRGITEEQYTAGGNLIADIFKRRNLALAAPPNPILLAHEDLCPCRRTDKKSRPWDPGAQVDLEQLWVSVLDALPSSGVLDRAALLHPRRG